MGVGGPTAQQTQSSESVGTVWVRPAEPSTSESGAPTAETGPWWAEVVPLLETFVPGVERVLPVRPTSTGVRETVETGSTRPTQDGSFVRGRPDPTGGPESDVSSQPPTNLLHRHTGDERSWGRNGLEAGVGQPKIHPGDQDRGVSSPRYEDKGVDTRPPLPGTEEPTGRRDPGDVQGGGTDEWEGVGFRWDYSRPGPGDRTARKGGRLDLVPDAGRVAITPTWSVDLWRSGSLREGSEGGGTHGNVILKGPEPSEDKTSQTEPSVTGAH